MYVYYSEEDSDADIQEPPLSTSGPGRAFRRAKHAWLVLLTVCGFAFIILVISATILVRFTSVSLAWAELLGVAVAALACVQWIPQALMTWNLGDLGSLSLLSLCIMTPVCLVVSPLSRPREGYLSV